MAGLIGTYQDYKRSSMGNLARAAQDEARVDAANDALDAQRSKE